ncbi:MAG TPA: hypothetical protein VHC97_26465 [Thermoanaerobaculia bacterium]|jgi:hypothetical protein|nr:hypothetical protein [Thermoanaerobaculia bacterium]
MRRTWILSVIAVISCFALGWTNSQPVLRLLQSGPVKVSAHLQWASNAGTVGQQVEEADAIVRGRIVKVLTPRVFESQLPSEPEDRRSLPRFSVVALTEAILVVDHVYTGDVPNRIRIIQTGGFVPGNGNHPELLIEVADDPLLTKGKDHVFFLKKIPEDDPVLGGNGKLYTIVNSAGRYDVDGDKVKSYSALPGQRPTSLRDLRQQIRVAVNR